MTIAAQSTNRTSATGNGVTTSFAFNLPFTAQADLVVLLVLVASPFTPTTQVLNTDYTISGTADAQGRYGSGANVVFVTAPSSLYNVVIYADPVRSQGLDLVENDEFPVEQVELALDKLTLIARRLDDKDARSLRQVDGDATSIAALPAKGARASMYLAFDAAGDPIASPAPTGSNVVSIFMATVLDDADAATAANTLAVIAKAIGTAKGDLIGFTGNATPVRKAAGSNGQALHADSSQSDGLVYLDNPSRPNLLTNPNWQIDQINEGALYTVNTTAVNGPDGWSGDAVGAGVFKLRTLADPDNAARKCLEISCTTADASIAATDRYEVWTAVEGYDTTEFLIGTSGAKSATVQFKLKSNSVTGVFGVYFSNSAGNRFYAGTITIADTSEHEYSVAVPTFDTTGTWLYTNGIGLRMGLVLSAGSNFQGTAGAWTASTVRTTASQANFMSVNTNILYLKPAQLIPGALVQAYRAADIQKELAKAQRQYFKTYNQGVVPGTATNVGCMRGLSFGNSVVAIPVYSKVTMRTTPTWISYSPGTGATGQIRNESSGADAASSGFEASDGSVEWEGTLAGTSQIGTVHSTANCRLS